MPFTLAETFFKVLIVVQKSFKHTLDHNFLSYLKSTDPCLLIARVFFSYRRPSTTRSPVITYIIITFTSDFHLYSKI